MEVIPSDARIISGTTGTSDDQHQALLSCDFDYRAPRSLHRKRSVSTDSQKDEKLTLSCQTNHQSSSE